MKFECNKLEKCKLCGNCCRYLREKILDSLEEDKIKRAIFNKTGVIYGFSLNRLGLSLTANEKTDLENAARELNIKIRILPKKIFITDKGVIIYDYFIDSDSCPFLKDSRCQIYDVRPKICRDFPTSKYNNQDFVVFSHTHTIVKEDYDKNLLSVEKFLHSFKCGDSKKTQAVS